jgi:predicted MarR family transcription regulator
LKQFNINEILVSENHLLQKQSIESGNTIRRLQSDYYAYKKSSQQEFSCLKAEIITSLRAINLCLLASINTEKQQLTHRARNFRMSHVNQIISNEIDRFCDCKLTSYEDDF